MKIGEFWDSTYGEIYLTIENFNEIETARVKEKATWDYALANLIALSVARLMDKNAKYPPIHEVYPSLFEAPITHTLVQQDPAIALDRMMRFAAAHNNKRGVVTDDN